MASYNTATTVRVGCDLVNLARFERVLARTPAVRRKLFFPSEERGASSETLAGIFAAKEAAMKALELPAGSWKKIRVAKKRNGRPEFRLPAALKRRIISQDVSISHDGDYAVAMAVFLLQGIKSS